MAPQKGSKRVVKDRPALTAMGFQRVQDRREMAEYRRRRVERDEQQRDIDAVVNEAYEAWIDSGRPPDWNDQPGTFWTGPQAELETLQWRVRKAGEHFTLKIRFGQLVTVTAPEDVLNAAAVQTYNKSFDALSENQQAKIVEATPYAEVVFTVTERDPKEEADPEEAEAEAEAAADEAAETVSEGTEQTEA
jgi:hypothetical protein